MQRLLSGLAVLGLAFTLGVGLTGCKKAPNNNTTTPSSSGTTKIEYDVFPTEVVVLKAGSKSEAIAIKRKGTAPKDQQLEFKSSDDKVSIEGGKFKGEGKETTIIITADPKAPTKEHTIKVIAGDVTKEFKVKVEPAGSGDGDTIAKAAYKFDPEETVTVKQGATATLKITRKGGKMKEKAVTIDAPADAKLSLEMADKAKFAEDGADVTIKIKAAADAPKKKTKIKIKAGDKEIGEIEVTVTAAGSMNILPGRDLFADTRRIEAIPQSRVSVTRQVALFTREF